MKWLLVLVAGCGTNAVVITPIVDVPIPSDTAVASALDEITLAVAHEGALVDTSSVTVRRGQAFELGGVPFGDDLVVHMTGRVGTSEVAYGRTCRFAVSATGNAPQPHLFFSRSVRFGDLDYTPQFTRANGNAITYEDGSGILVGGVDPNDGRGIEGMERLDPHTGEFRTFGSVQPRRGAVAAVLGTGAGASRIILIGGTDPSGSGAPYVEIIDPSSPIEGRVDKIDDAQMAREALSVTELSNGNVIVIGGKAPGVAPSDLIHEVAFENGSAAVRQTRGRLKHPRWKHTATRLGDDVGAVVLVAGGLDDTTGPVAEAELYKPLSETLSTTVYPMKTPRSRHQAVRMPDGSVLIIGGVDAMGNPISKLERFTLDEGFQEVGEMPVNAGLIEMAVTPLPDGRILISGGRSRAVLPPVDAAFIARLDPIDGSVDVIATDHLAVPRANHQATLLCDGTILVAGGTTNPVPAERYNPPALGRR